MIYIAIDDEGKATGWANDRSMFEEGTNVISRWDYTDINHVTQVAADLTEATGKLFIPVDSGPTVSPRYDVIAAPVVGDQVSMSFNGDTYPMGKIVAISNTMKVITVTTGEKFYRVNSSGIWRYNRIWTLVAGFHKSYNDHV